MVTSAPHPIAGLMAALVCAGATGAQHNDVERRNSLYLWLEATGHPNGNPFPDRRQNPPAHATPAGVAPGTRSYVWIPSHANHHSGAERIDGFRAPLGPSSATLTYPALLYYPEVAVHPTVHRPAGHVEPDPAALPHLVLPEAPLVFGRFGFYESGSSLLDPVPLPQGQREVVVSRGGSRSDSRWTPDTLQMWGDAYGDRYSLPVYGFVDPAGTVSAVSATAPYGYLNLTYRRAEPTVDARSDWGKSYLSQTTHPGLWGSSISTYEGRLSGRGGKIAWDVRAGAAYAGAMAIPMLNVGPIHPSPRVVLAQSIDLDVDDPALPLLAPRFIVSLDSTGFARGLELDVMPLGASALGKFAGVEYLLVDAGLTQLLATTQAVWVELQ
jgi:hypothetical protein